MDFEALDVDYLSFSFHKMLAPFGVGVLFAKEHLLEATRPFLYGGDMIAEGQVFPDRVAYNDLPWKYARRDAEHPRHHRLRAGDAHAAGSGAVAAAPFPTSARTAPITHDAVCAAMARVAAWTRT